MGFLEADILMLLGTVVETAVVYTVTGAAALYVVHTFVRAFRPRQIPAAQEGSNDEVPRNAESPCGSCHGCGSQK